MKINHDIIQAMEPCQSRYDNFKQHYPDFDGDHQDFLDLEKITYSDKIWVLAKLMTKNQYVLWAVLCAESVKHIFNDARPDDNQLNEVLDALLKIQDYSNMSKGDMLAVESALLVAKSAESSAVLAARSAADSTWSKNWGIRSAAWSVLLAARAAARASESAGKSVSESASLTAIWAARTGKQQEDLNLMLMMMVIEGVD